MEIREILIANNFRYNHSLGQNFITDGNLLNAVCSDAGVEKSDVVVEIGAGAGSLTRVLSERAKKVYAFEIDENLRPILNTVLKDCDNVQVIFKDILKMSDGEIKEIVGESFKVVANLPYYITTPLIMRFLESTLPYTDLTLMMQKEVAERLIAKSGTAEYGAITVAVESRGNAAITRNIDRRNFYPVPKVDSALIHIEKDENKCVLADDKIFKKAVKAAFLWRRKTLQNNLKSMFSLSKETCEKILNSAEIPLMARGETLDLEGFMRLTEAIKAEI